MGTCVIIPSRYSSSRFPGKPLAIVAGLSLIQRVYKIAVASHNPKDVYVATDDQGIFEEVSSFGGNCIMTSPECLNGSERVYEAFQKLDKKYDLIINLQGDAVLTPPWIIRDLITSMENEACFSCGTVAVEINNSNYQKFLAQKQKENMTGTMVVFSGSSKALYFSRSMIPWFRDQNKQDKKAYRHIGIYAYTPEILERYLTLPQMPLEKVECLEQLRFLENDIDIKVVEVDYKGRTHCSIDEPHEIKLAEDIIAKEGELWN